MGKNGDTGYLGEKLQGYGILRKEKPEYRVKNLGYMDWICSIYIREFKMFRPTISGYKICRPPPPACRASLGTKSDTDTEVGYGILLGVAKSDKVRYRYKSALRQTYSYYIT